MVLLDAMGTAGGKDIPILVCLCPVCLNLKFDFLWRVRMEKIKICPEKWTMNIMARCFPLLVFLMQVLDWGSWTPYVSDVEHHSLVPLNLLCLYQSSTDHLHFSRLQSICQYVLQLELRKTGYIHYVLYLFLFHCLSSSVASKQSWLGVDPLIIIIR